MFESCDCALCGADPVDKKCWFVFLFFLSAPVSFKHPESTSAVPLGSCLWVLLALPPNWVNKIKRGNLEMGGSWSRKKKKRTKWWSEREESRGGAQRRRKARRLHCVTPIGDINGKGKRLLPSCFWRTLALHLIPPAQLGKGHSALFLTMTALFLFQNNAS